MISHSLVHLYFRGGSFFGAALSLLIGAIDVVGQEAVGTSASPAWGSPTTSISESTPATLNSPSSPELHPNPNTVGNEVSAEPRRLQYQFKLTMLGVYDDNINIGQTRVADYYFAIEPVLTLGAGDLTGQQDNYVRFDYAPSLFLFADHSEDDAFQQLFRVEGQHHFSRLTLTLGEEVAVLDGTDLRSFANQTTPSSQANTDVGARTKFQTYNTRLGASYDLSGKTFISTEFDSLATEYNSSSLFSSANFSENFLLNYRYSDKLTVGVGGTGGYDTVDQPNPNQTFEQANVRLSYQVLGKLSLNASGGVEFRQFEHNSRGQYISPVFDLSSTYQPSDATTFTLSGSRRTLNSAVLVAEDFAETLVTATARQRFLQRFYVGVGVGYQNSDYFSTINGLVTNRRDNYYFLEPSLDFSITRFWTAGGYYLHRQNDSSSQLFRFDDNQFGFRTALAF